jgi:hypothetical protein
MNDELRKAGVAHVFAGLTRWLDEKKMVPLILIATELEGGTSAVAYCGPDLSDDEMIVILRGFADQLEKKAK